jgi:hypothetical protein
MSAGPPGPKGTTILTGLAGQLCATAGIASALKAAIKRPSLVAQRIFFLPILRSHDTASQRTPMGRHAIVTRW